MTATETAPPHFQQSNKGVFSLFRLLAFLLPFLSFCQIWRYPPIASFHNEWAAYVLGALLLTSTYLLHRNKSEDPLNRITLTGLLFTGLALLTLAQALLGKLVYAHSALLLTGIVVLVVGLSSLGAQCCIDGRSKYLCADLASGLIAAGLVNTFAALLQFHGLFVIGLQFVPLPPPARLDGLLGQPNHFGMLCALGMACIWWKWQEHREKPLPWLLLFLPLSWGLASSGSRTALLAFALGWAFLFSIDLRTPTHPQRRALFITAIALVSILVGHELLTTISVKAGPLRTTGGEGRIELIHASIELIPKLPLLGIGFGEFAWARFAETYAGLQSFTSTHTHNVLLQLLVEWGFPGLLLGLIFLASWGRLAFKAWLSGHSIERLSILITGAIGAHSMLEYPLWYTYFLFPFAIFTALAGERSFTLRSDVNTYLAKGFMWAGLTCLGILAGADYIRTQTITVAGVRQQLEGAANIQLPVQEINRIAALTLFQGEADTNLARTLEPDPFFLDMKMQVVEQTARYHPTPETLARLILFLAYTGQDERALSILNRLKPYSGHFHGVSTVLEALDKRFPNILGELLDRAGARLDTLESPPLSPQ